MIEIIRDLQGMAGLRTAWNQLADRLGNPLSRHEWYLGCARSFCPPGRLRVVVYSRGGRIAAVVPMEERTRRGMPSLELLGVFHLYEPSGLVYEDGSALQEALREVLRLEAPVLLPRMPTGGPELAALDAVARRRGLLLVRDATGAPYMDFASMEGSLEAGMSPSRRSGLRRARRRAEELGAVSITIGVPSPATLDSVVAEMVRVEASGWKGRSGTALQSDVERRRFFQEYAHAAAEAGILRVGELRIDGRLAAFQFALEHSRRFWLLKIGYDEVFASCSPGIILMNESIRQAHARGLAGYEFLGTDQPWMHMWTRQVRAYSTARAYPFSVTSAVGLGVELSQYWLAKTFATVGMRRAVATSLASWPR
jgi:CelD/BcsL family acetyltransferase involved in cellulose biosynthesis